MSETAIVNIINFIRGVEPRDSSIDLLGTVEKQIHLVQNYGLPATWLLQYDALINLSYQSLLKNLDSSHEIGAWFEVVQPQVEKAGLPWRGRPGFPWDWHAQVGFSIGYTPRERELLADVLMTDFKEIFGYYPSSVGSWFMDAHLIAYLHERYGVSTCCICRDQWGTDGYTLWGGYYSQAYYPSKKNSFMPAQNQTNQIPVPIFRMLGSDPIYQYDAGISANGQSVMTLEPSYPEGGGNPEWVDWFLGQVLLSPSLSFGYAQVGQENSFGWPIMEKGLTYQIESLQKMKEKGKIHVETLESSGKRFRSKYPLTPSSAVTALEDWKGEGRKSVWYDSSFYRVNLFWDSNGFSIRDMRLFDEEYAERYLDQVCRTDSCIYDTLPVIDGLLWGDGESCAGIHLIEILPDGQSKPLEGASVSVQESRNSLIVRWALQDNESAEVHCDPTSWTLIYPSARKWALEFQRDKSKSIPVVSILDKELQYRYEGFSYKIRLKSGEFHQGKISNSILLLPDTAGHICLDFSNKI